MKTASIMFIMLSICFIPCHGQKRSSVGTDLAAICNSTMRISCEYAFCKRWTAGGEVAINMKKMSRPASDEEKSHWSELYGSRFGTTPDALGDSFIETAAIFSFWPSDAFEGTVLNIGGCIRDRYGPDMIAGIGYSCKVWKGLRLKTTYNIRIADSIRQKHLPLDGIRIMIGYVF